MADVTFYSQFLEGATLTGADYGSTLPNLLDRNPNHLWTGVATGTSQYIEVNFGSARAVNAVVIDNHNLATVLGGGTVVIQSSTDGITFTQQASMNVPSSATLIIVFPSVSAQYWQIVLNNSAGFTTAPQIGNVSMGASIVLSQPYDSQSEHGEQFATEARRSINGTPYGSQPYAGIETWKWKWTAISTADQMNFLNLSHNVRGMLRAFYMTDADGTTTRLVLLTTDLLQLQRRAHSLYDSRDIELRAFLTDTIALT